MSPPHLDAEETLAELRALLEALLDRLDPWLRAQTAEAAESDAPDCGWCPLCAAAAALRGERPDLLRRLSEQGLAWLSTVRLLVEEHEHAGEPAPASEAPDPGVTADTRPRVQQIPVVDSGRWR
ncbi:hypothetical protein [Rhodococcus sp. X156]|uniref:hypothetical protein n=1 Tax=Rhodococcus sp. X156 TaxID=2499145 RepID=UPI000FDBE2EB|nr:hypothetical protein [Rhodococcus sp. X156]